jgi:hypothetical protein
MHSVQTARSKVFAHRTVSVAAIQTTAARRARLARLIRRWRKTGNGSLTS